MMRATWVDRAIGFVSPRAATRRVLQRAALDSLLGGRRGYEGASQGRRTDGWRSANSSADAEVWAAGTILRDRMRDLVRNNPHAAKAIAVLATNIVGDGIVPRAKTGDDEKNKVINSLWERFSKTCDADGQLDFLGLQTLACREMLEGGEVLIRRRMRKLSDGLPVPMQLQILEADLLDASRTSLYQDGTEVIQGVEFDKIGRRSKYWLFTQHPGNNFAFSVAGLTSKPVAARDILHVYEKQRTQVRGVPWGAPAMSTLRDLDEYEDAELMRKKIEACLVGVVTGGDELDMGVGIALEENQKPGVYDADGTLVERFEPGMFLHARGGRDVKFNAPAATSGHEAYKRVTLRTVAAGFRVPYELISGDLAEVNYSSIRAGLVEFRRLVSSVQWQIFIPMFCQPVWDWFVQAAYFAGEIDTDQVPVEWSPPRFVSVDPFKDAMAALTEVRSGQRSLFDVIAETGRNPRDVLTEIAEANALLDQLGIKLDSDPRHTDKSGILQDPAVIAAALSDGGGAASSKAKA
ncbi:phage portal protein [Kaistia sp. MMO-174]|uniref:phage portal protein n=1 Tax=Kaistia sp. MMO-174 TaxID=3081256 RepID=UPI00301906E2